MEIIIVLVLIALVYAYFTFFNKKMDMKDVIKLDQTPAQPPVAQPEPEPVKDVIPTEPVAVNLVDDTVKLAEEAPKEEKPVAKKPAAKATAKKPAVRTAAKKKK